MDTKLTEKMEVKKAWITPKLIVHGNVEKITAEGQPPPKTYGTSDGATWNGLDVHWTS